MNLKGYIKNKLADKIAGVSVHFDTGEGFSISYVVLQRKAGKIRLVRADRGITEMDRFVESIPKAIPIWIIISGRNVITKKLLSDPGEKYLNHILPNVRESDFIVSRSGEANGELFVSAVRQEVFSSVTTIFKEKGFKIIGYSIGPAILSGIVNYGFLDHPQLHIPGYKIDCENSSLKDIKVSEEIANLTYKLGTDELHADQITAFAVAFTFLFSDSETDTIVSESVTDDFQSYFFSRLNKMILIGSLGLIFLLLLINFFVFSTLNSKKQILSGDLSYQESLFIRYDSLKAEFNGKKALIDQIGLTRNSRFSYFVDRIASIVPSEITLNSMVLNPVDEKIRAERPIKFTKLIRIDGTSNSSIILNDWTRDLEKYHWIKNIEIVRYERNDNMGEFEILIYY